MHYFTNKGSSGQSYGFSNSHVWMWELDHKESWKWSCSVVSDSFLPGSSLHGILQARILEWVAISLSRESSRPRDRTQVFRIPGRCFKLWATGEAEHWRIDAFELRCWRRLLRVPWTARRSNQSIPKEISPEYALEGLILNWNSNTLATWCEEPTHWKRLWCWERLRAGGEGDDRGWDGWMASLTQWTWISVNSGSWWWTGRPGVLQSMGSQRVRHDWATELNWTDSNATL